MTDERVEASLRAKLERLHLATSDMRSAAIAARHLIATFSKVREGANRPGLYEELELYLVLVAGMFVTYARAFNESRGDPPLPRAPSSGLDARQRAIHDWAIAERDQVWAHVDRGGHRRMIEGSIDGTPDRMFETLRPPSREELADFLELIEVLRERYQAEAQSLEHEMRARG